MAWPVADAGDVGCLYNTRDMLLPLIPLIPLISLLIPPTEYSYKHHDRARPKRQPLERDQSA